MAPTSETRAVGDFSKVALTLGELRLKQQQTPSLTIEADEEILAKLRSEVRGDTLVLEFAGDWLEKLTRGLWAFTQGPIVYHLGVRALRGVSLTGQGEVRAEALTTDSLELSSVGVVRVALGALTAERLSVQIGGRGDVEIAGRVREQRVVISGSGDYRALELASARARVQISGHGQAAVAASDTLSVTISGYGKVAYAGEPVVSQAITGAGSVVRLGARDQR